MTKNEKYELVGKQAPAADGGNYGILIIAYDENSDDFIVVNVSWSKPEILPTCNHIHYLDTFKASYRYQLNEAIPVKVS